jgi:hypothetical protein
MRVAIVFFLSLCFFTFVNNFQANAETRRNTGGQILISHIEKIQQTANRNFDVDLPAFRKNTLTETNDEIVIAVDEDEDFVFNKKNILPPRYFLVLHSTSISFYPYSYSKKRLAFCNYLSYNSSPKYILQRVLRI